MLALLMLDQTGTAEHEARSETDSNQTTTSLLVIQKYEGDQINCHSAG